jgi:hypothetical protein
VRATSPSAAAGYVRYATRAGAAASVRFTGRAIGWVAPMGPTRGSAKVYVDGVYKATVSLYRSSFAARRIVFRASWASSGAHTIRIVVVGTAHRPRVDVDAFALIR